MEKTLSMRRVDCRSDNGTKILDTEINKESERGQ